MDNEASTALKMTMNSMKIKYQLVPRSNHRAKKFRESDTKFQKPLRSGTVNSRQIILSSTVGHTITAGNNYPNFDKTICLP